MGKNTKSTNIYGPRQPECRTVRRVSLRLLVLCPSSGPSQLGRTGPPRNTTWLSINLVQEQKSELRDVRDIFLCKKEQLSGDKDASACRVQIKQGTAPMSQRVSEGPRLQIIAPARANFWGLPTSVQLCCSATFGPCVESRLVGTQHPLSLLNHSN